MTTSQPTIELAISHAMKGELVELDTEQAREYAHIMVNGSPNPHLQLYVNDNPLSLTTIESMLVLGAQLEYIISDLGHYELRRS